MLPPPVLPVYNYWSIASKTIMVNAKQCMFYLQYFLEDLEDTVISAGLDPIAQLTYLKQSIADEGRKFFCKT